MGAVSGRQSDSAPMDIPMLIGRALAVGELTQEELAERVGVTQGTIQKWLAATRRPGVEHWDAIAAAADVDRTAVAVAYGATALVRASTLRERLAHAEAEVVRLRAENDDLRGRLQAGQ